MKLCGQPMTFGKQPFVAIYVTPDGYSDMGFTAQWKADKSVDVRTFRRVVRAGGASTKVIVTVVRRKVAKESNPA